MSRTSGLTCVVIAEDRCAEASLRIAIPNAEALYADREPFAKVTVATLGTAEPNFGSRVYLRQARTWWRSSRDPVDRQPAHLGTGG